YTRCEWKTQQAASLRRLSLYPQGVSVLTDFQAIVLGIVQGVTEFLPISSNAHLKIVQVLLGWQDAGAPFVAVCEWGTLLASMIFFALLLALAEWRKSSRKTIEDVTVTDGLLVGLGQACALIPGASRSGTTITAALFAGFDRAAAARFSFLLSLPAIFGAGLK